jgi:hypothetical protein
MTRLCLKCKQQRPVGLFSRDRSKASGLHPYCRACRTEQARLRRGVTPERTALRAKRFENSAERLRAWRAANPERVLELANRGKPERRLAAQAKWRAANVEQERARARAYRLNNPAQYAANAAARRAATLRARPAWANRFFLSEAYALAALRSQVTGTKWQVDHIVPLRSPLVCGLHVDNNLQVIPAAANASKGNRYWPDMPA